MEITVNGEPRQVERGLTLQALIALLKLQPLEGGVAVGLNGQLVPRRQWESQTLAPGDQLEIVQAIQGG